MATTAMASGTPQASSSSIELTTRDDLSRLYRVLRVILKPLRPRLVNPPKTPFPEGSPRLDPPNKRNIIIKETKAENVWMYHLHALGPKGSKRSGTERAHGPEEKKHLAPPMSHNMDANTLHMDGTSTKASTGPRTPARKHRVYYFSGGGFQSPPSGEHWRFLAQLAQDLAGHRFSVTFPGSTSKTVDPDDFNNAARLEMIVVSPPLAPKSPASETLRVLRKWLQTVMDDAAENRETLSLMGDSSGANMIMSLGFWAVQNYTSTNSARNGTLDTDDKSAQVHTPTTTFPLTSLITISGPMDLTNSSPEIPHADTLDVVLTAKLTHTVAETWCGHSKNRLPQYEPTPVSSPEVSPLFQTEEAWQALVDKQVQVHGVYGTHDVLAPSGLDFMKKCQEKGVKGKWLVWEGQMHCFPLAGGGEWLGIREGREAREWVEKVLRSDAEILD